MNVEAKGLDYKALNEAIRAAGPSCRITGCLGQRFIGAGMSGRQVEIDGIPGNALGAYLGGGTIYAVREQQNLKVRALHVLVRPGFCDRDAAVCFNVNRDMRHPSHLSSLIRATLSVSFSLCRRKAFS